MPSPRLELKNLLVARAFTIGLALMLAAGFLAIHHGRHAILAQRHVIAESPRLEAEHRRKMIELHRGPETDGPGNLLYYLNFFTTREPSRFAPIAVGLRDVTPFNLKIRILTLEGQIRDTEIGNPEAQSLGHFDLAFLLTFLYPLWIAALLHDTLSAEVEAGTWDLIRSHRVNRVRLLLSKALLRFAPVPATWLLTVLAAAVILDLPLDQRFAAWIALSLAYLLFWFSVSLLVIAFRRSSNFNALALLSIWLLLAVILPVGINLGITSAVPSTGAFEAAVRQREGYHQQWDRPHRDTMQAFYFRYPELRNHPIPEDKFSWGWYYAMQQQGDVEAAQAVSVYAAAQQRREFFSTLLTLIAPPALLEFALTRIAATGLSTHLAYIDSVRLFHERIRRFFYPFLFRDPPIPAVDWASLPRHRFSDEHTPVPFPPQIFILTAESIALALIALRLLARRL